MYAHVRTYQINEGEIEKRLQHARETAVPAGKRQKGSKGLLILVDPVSHKNMTIAFWETEADMLAAQKEEDVTSRFSHRQYAAGDVTTENFLVAHQDWEPDEQSASGR